MRCLYPRTVGFLADGKTISWSPKSFSKEFATFQLPCGKCLECRLDYARQWAIRCVHEASVHTKSSFITLTYDQEHLKSPKLIYSDFQKFMKKLRKVQDERIGVFVTGEYGDESKRPHWHALLFGWAPNDREFKYANHRGDKVYSSATLSRLWGHGIAEAGSITFESAGYVARYAAKKIVHGPNQLVREADHHEWQPISKKSSKHAIGKKWLERYWPDVFNYGELILPNGTACAIPRYYEKWLKENQPEAYLKYVCETKQKKIDAAIKRSEAETAEQNRANSQRQARMLSDGILRGWQTSPAEARKIILRSKFQLLQNHLKL